MTSPVCPSPPPDGTAGTDTRPDDWQADDAGTPARRWVPWDTWLTTYEQDQGSAGRTSSGSVRPAR